MIEMQAAIGRVQLRRMERWTTQRTANANRLALAYAPFAAGDGPIRLPRMSEVGSKHAWYRFYAYVHPERLARGWDRDRIIAEIGALGVPAFQGSCSEVYRERAFDGTGWRPPVSLPVARELGETSMAFLVHPSLRESDMDLTCAAIAAVMKRAAGA